jgi:hypothetical protein
LNRPELDFDARRDGGGAGFNHPSDVLKEDDSDALGQANDVIRQSAWRCPF